MPKTMRSLACLFMCFALVFSMNAWSNLTVIAEENAVQPRLNYTAYTMTSMNITTSGVAYCTANVEGYDGITTKIHINMKLQQYLALQWTTIGEWQGTFNDVVGALSKSKTLTSSGRYRVRVTYTVYSGSASEEVIGTSQEKYYTRP